MKERYFFFFFFQEKIDRLKINRKITRIPFLVYRSIDPWKFAYGIFGVAVSFQRASPLSQEKEEAGKTDRARSKQMVAGAAYVPLGVRPIIPSVFSFYATAPANDISRPARSIIVFSKISFPSPGGRVRLEDGTNDRLEMCVAVDITRRLLPRKREENILRRAMRYRVMWQSWLAWDGNNFTFDHK